MFEIKYKRNRLPKNSLYKLYFKEKTTLSIIHQAIKDKWGDISFDKVLICSDVVKTHSLISDPCDSDGIYENFILVKYLY